MEVTRIKKDWPQNPEHELEAYIYQFEDAEIINPWKDFSGMKNDNGTRNFNILIEDEELANRLADDGLNVKIIAPKNEGDPVRWNLKIILNMNEVTSSGKKRRLPEIHYIDSITHADRILSNGNLVNELDNGKIIICDLQVTPWWYNMRGNQGYSLYLQWGQFVVEENEERFGRNRLNTKYAPEDPDMPF